MQKLDSSPSIVHSIRFEMMDKSALLYFITDSARAELMHWIEHATNRAVEFREKFVTFHALPDRLVFVSIEDISRMVFCWDTSFGLDQRYVDNFTVLHSLVESAKDVDGTESLFSDLLVGNSLPSAIVKLRKKKKPLVFEFLDDIEMCGGNLDSLDLASLFTDSVFLRLPDLDGEDNCIPVANILCMETERSLVIPDDLWAAMNDG